MLSNPTDIFEKGIFGFGDKSQKPLFTKEEMDSAKVNASPADVLSPAMETVDGLFKKLQPHEQELLMIRMLAQCDPVKYPFFCSQAKKDQELMRGTSNV